MIQFGKLRFEIARAFERHGIKSYRMHTDEPAGFLTIELGPFDLKFNVKYLTLMISARNIPHPRAIPFKHWRGNLDLARLGLDPAWWENVKEPILAVMDLISAQYDEPPAAVENPDALAHLVNIQGRDNTRPPVDELLQFQTVVNVSMRDGAHAAPV